MYYINESYLTFLFINHVFQLSFLANHNLFIYLLFFLKY